MLIKVHITTVNIQGNKFNCNWLPRLTATYRPSIIAYFYANKIKLMHYDQLPYINMYDSNTFLLLKP